MDDAEDDADEEDTEESDPSNIHDGQTMKKNGEKVTLWKRSHETVAQNQVVLRHRIILFPCMRSGVSQ